MLKWLGLQYSVLFITTLPTLTSMYALRSSEFRKISCALCNLGFIVHEVQFVESFVAVWLRCLKNISTKLWCILEAVFLLAKLPLKWA